MLGVKPFPSTDEGGVSFNTLTDSPPMVRWLFSSGADSMLAADSYSHFST